MKKRCLICAKEIGKFRKKFCSDTCAIIYKVKVDDGHWKKRRLTEKYRIHNIFRGRKHYWENREKRLVELHTYRKFKKEFCVDCGKKEKLEFHHFSYTPPYGSFVVLCFDCHRKVHCKDKILTAGRLILNPRKGR